MANEVNINITAHNLTGPGFAGATASAVTFGNVVTNITNKFSGASVAARAMGSSLNNANSMIEKGTRQGGLLGGVVQALTSHIKLFGGALDQIGLPKILSMVSGWHLLTEAVIETAAVWGPAAIAATAFGLAATPVVIDLTKQMQSLYTASKAVDQAVYPLSGNFQKAADAVKPQVYQLFGEALIVASKNGGTFQAMATGVGKSLDDLGARFVAATSSGKGVSKFAEQSVTDFKLLGDSIGNFGGIIGNVFKAVPGYAEILLKIGDNLLHLVEVFTNAAEPVLQFGLAAHGALIYLGLLGTLIAKLAMSGFATIESLAMKAALGLMNFGSAGVKAGGALASFSGMMGKAAALPWGWIGIGVGAIIALGVALNSVKTDAQNFNDTIQKTLQDTSMNNLTATLAEGMAATQTKLTQSTQQLSKAISTNTQVFAGRAGTLNSNGAAIGRLATASNDYRDGLRNLQSEANLVDGRISQLSKQYGGNANALALLNAAGITTSQILDKNNSHWAQAVIEMKATQDAMQATTQSAGRLGAAENALNFAAADTANKLGEDQDLIQKFTKAQDDLLNALTAGETGFVGFNQALQQMGVDAGISNGYLKQNLYTQKITGQTMILGTKSIDGLNDASLKLAGDYYGQVIPAAEKLITALETQKISTKDLTTVVATEAASMLKFAGNNTAAKVAIVDLVNNALGPNTVSLKNLREWVDKNSTSMTGFRSIVDKTLISASKLAGVIQNDLNAMFAQALIKTTGADKALQAYTKDIVANQQDTSKGLSDRARLIKDLENTGMSADAARKYVDGLSTSVHNLKSKNISIGMKGDGTYTISQGPGSPPIIVGGHADGRYITTGKGSRVDDNLVAVSKGELIVPAHLVAAGETDHLRGKIPGYSSGGLIGGNLTPSFITGGYQKFQDTMTAAMVAAMRAALKAAEQAAAAAAAASGGGSAGPGGGSAGQNQALAKQLMPSWSTGSMWSAWQNLWNRESGWSQYADTRKSGLDPPNASVFAYGIPQSRPYSKMPKAGWPADHGGSSNPHAQETWGIGYIQTAYHNPINAWNHEVSQGWYDNGGWLKPGLNMAYNGTGKPERVMGPDDWGGMIQLEITSGGQSAFEQFMLKMIREFVRVKGGGDVRKAFEGKK